MDALNRGEEYGNQYWMIQIFTGHRKDPSNTEKWQVKVLWHNEKKTWESISVIKKNDPFEMVIHLFETKTHQH